MEILESGKYLLSADEIGDYVPEATHLRDKCEMLIDLSQPLDVAEMMFLKFASLVLEGDRDSVERALAYFDDQIQLSENKH